MVQNTQRWSQGISSSLTILFAAKNWIESSNTSTQLTKRELGCLYFTTENSIWLAMRQIHTLTEVSPAKSTGLLCQNNDEIMRRGYSGRSSSTRVKTVLSNTSQSSLFTLTFTQTKRRLLLISIIPLWSDCEWALLRISRSIGSASFVRLKACKLQKQLLKIKSFSKISRNDFPQTGDADDWHAYFI